ncbi:MAG: hypothetical protein ACAI38_10970 [Myxococcota bacterium]|nr:hypothetical protein [Myxococcota bacterium]
MNIHVSRAHAAAPAQLPNDFGKPISCRYNNNAFMTGKDNGVAAAVFAWQPKGFTKIAAVQFCDRPDGTSYVLISQQGSVYGNGVMNHIINPPQEVLKTYVDRTGETVFDINTARLDFEKPASQMQLRRSRDGKTLTVFDRSEKVAELPLTWSKA